MLRSILRMEKMAAIRRVLHQQGLLVGTVRSHVLATLPGLKEEEHDIDMADGMEASESEPEDVFDVYEQESSDEHRQPQNMDMDRQPAEGNHEELVDVSDVKLAARIRTSFSFALQ